MTLKDFKDAKVSDAVIVTNTGRKWCVAEEMEQMEGRA